MSSNILGPLILIGFFVILFAMVAFVVYAVRKETAQKEKFAAELGFSGAAETPELLERIAYVNGRNRPGLLHLTHVFRRQSAAGEIYMFSLHRRNFDEHGIRRGKRSSRSHYSPLETNVFAFISPTWQLPQLVATPRLEGSGKLVAMANQIADSFVEANMNRLQFPQIPGLDEKYILATQNPDPAQVIFSDAFLILLASNPNLSLHTGRDTLTISYAKSITNPPDDERLRQLYKLGIQFAREIHVRKG